MRIDSVRSQGFEKRMGLRQRLVDCHDIDSTPRVSLATS